MGFGQAIDNMNNNFKRMFNPGNILLALSNTRAKYNFTILTDKFKDFKVLNPEEFARGAGAVGFPTRGIRCFMYLKECQSLYSKYLRAYANPASIKIDKDQMDKDIETIEKIYDKYQSYKEAHLKVTMMLTRQPIMNHIQTIIKAASDINAEPSKTISQGYKLLEELRKKRHSAENSKLTGTRKLEEVKQNLDKAEDLFKFWEKFKQYTLRTLNDDIRRATNALQGFIFWVGENTRRIENGQSPFVSQIEASWGGEWEEGKMSKRDEEIQNLGDDDA